MPAFSYVWSLLVTRAVIPIWSAVSENATLHANLMALSFIEAKLWLIDVLHCGNTHFRPFLFLWPWPWPYTNLIPYFLVIHRMCNLLKALKNYRLTDIRTYTHTDRQTDKHDRNYISRRFAGGQNYWQNFYFFHSVFWHCQSSKLVQLTYLYV